MRRTLLFLSLLAFAAPRAASAEPRVVAEARALLKAGVTLAATVDVVVGAVELTKGMRVTVSRVHLAGDRPTCVDLSLPDGHVVQRVHLATVLASFTRA